MFGKAWKRECAWDGCSKLTETTYCRAHERAQGDSMVDELMRAGRIGARMADRIDGQLSSDEVMHYVWENCAGSQQDIQTWVPQLNSWLSSGWGIAVYQHDDLRIERILAHKLVSYGGPGAFIEDTEPPAALDSISFFEGPYTLTGTYSGTPLS